MKTEFIQELKTKHRIIIGDSRNMEEIDDESVHLMVTSPPYPMIEMWDDIFRQLDERIEKTWEKMEIENSKKRKEKYIREIYELMHENLAQVWKETYRVLVKGGIACINIGDATRSFNGIFRLFPNHSKVIEHCERIGFVTLPYILWKKPTTKPKYKGKGAFLGSGFLPPNAYITIDCEFILIFRKGELRKFKPHDELRYASRYTKNERDSWFTQIWDIVGIKQTLPEVERRVAAFPEEIPYRLIRMFSIIGDTVLDPFLGTGTTTKIAINLKRNSIGYEIDESLLPVIKEKVGITQKLLNSDYSVKIVKRF
ncbi:DNA-methyltransferase [Candidatus Pyrohabitans sp.]